MQQADGFSFRSVNTLFWSDSNSAELLTGSDEQLERTWWLFKHLLSSAKQQRLRIWLIRFMANVAHFALLWYRVGSFEKINICSRYTVKLVLIKPHRSLYQGRFSAAAWVQDGAQCIWTMKLLWFILAFLIQGGQLFWGWKQVVPSAGWRSSSNISPSRSQVREDQD